jgi:hypothetical protein
MSSADLRHRQTLSVDPAVRRAQAGHNMDEARAHLSKALTLLDAESPEASNVRQSLNRLEAAQVMMVPPRRAA